MQDDPPLTDAEFVFIEHKLRIRWDVMAIAMVYIAIWIFAAYTQHNRAVSVTCVVMAALCYPALALLSQLRERVSGAQADALRRRMDPRLSWRKRALSDR